MRRLTLSGIAVAVACSFTANWAAPALADSRYDFTWHASLAGGTRVSVSDVNGSTTVVQSRDREARVKATVSSKRGDARDVKIQVTQSGGALYVCPVYPGATMSAECKQNGVNVSHDDARVDFVIEIPKGSPLRAMSVNGTIDARGLDSAIDAGSVNEDMLLSSTDTVRAKTVNGNIDASIGARRWNGTLDFDTVNGGVTLRLPRDAAFGLRVNTLNGKITIRGFPITSGGGFVGHSASGTVGRAGGALNIKTVNGAVSLNAR